MPLRVYDFKFPWVSSKNDGWCRYTQGPHAGPGTTVQELEGERAVVTLGPWPEAGDTEQGQTLPAYRERARVLEPWLYHEEHVRDPDFEDKRRWERRFLD